MAKNIKVSRFLSKASFKDIIVLGFLLCADWYFYGDFYARRPNRKPLQDYPFQFFREYLEKIKGRKINKMTSYYRLKKYQVFTEKNGKIEINLNDNWWRDYFNLKFRFFIAPEVWDGYWTVVIFDIPEQQREIRREIRYFLKHLGFVQWQRSVWVTVNNVEEYVKKIISGAEPYVFCFRAKSLFGDRDEKLINKLFLPKELESKYNKFIIESEVILERKNQRQAIELIKELPELILEDRGVPGKFFDQPKIRSQLFKRTKQLHQLIIS